MRKLFIILLVVSIVSGIFMPSVAHAGLGEFTLTGILSVLNTIIEVPISLLIRGLEWTSQILQNAISFMPSEGGYPVYVIWKAN